MLKPLTNECIIAPVDELVQVSAGGIFLVNHYKKPTLKFRVLAVGPAGFVYRPNRKGKKKLVYRLPEVEVGDIVFSKALLESHPRTIHFEDGTGRLKVDADILYAKVVEE